jgi:hypothetical protein
MEQVNEIRRLQGCINDLISLLALPATWSSPKSAQIVGTLLDVLVGMRSRRHSKRSRTRKLNFERSLMPYRTASSSWDRMGILSTSIGSRWIIPVSRWRK